MVAIGVHHLLNSLHRLDDEVLNASETNIGFVEAILGGEVESHTIEHPLPPKQLIVILRLLLHCDIGEMNLSLTELPLLVAIVREPCEPTTVKVDGQRLVARYQHVNAHIELFIAHEQWIRYVALHNIVLRLNIICCLRCSAPKPIRWPAD